MASFAEIRAKMNSKYGDSEEEKKKQQEQKRQSSTASATSKSSFESVRSKMESKYNPANNVDESFLTVFLSDAKKYLDSAESDYSNMKFANSSSAYEDRKEAADDLRKRSFAVRQYLEKNKTSIDTEEYDSLMSYLDDFDRASSQSLYAFYKNNKYYSQWDTEEDYNKYLQEQKDYEDLLNFDLVAGEKEVKDLEALLDEYDYLIPRQDVANPASEYNVRLREIREQYGSKDDIKNLISEKNAYLNRAKYIQEGVTLAGVVGNADFDANNDYVSTKSDNWWSRLTSDYGLGYDDLTYEYINGAENGMRSEIRNKAIVYNADNSLHETDKWTIYDHMTEDEIAIYNYYYSKDGKEKAQEYLDSIQETLNHREATSMYENMEDKTLLELAFGVAAGLDQFESGVKNLFNTKDDYIPTTATQIASGMVREDLADESIPIWYNFEEGKWEDKVLGNSLGQIGYDTITTTANMAPSMLTAIAIGSLSKSAGTAFAAKAFATAGEIAGNTMMFASSAGNAYQEALNLGYDKSQARRYSTLVGASEAGLQYLLGGISSLGGKASGAALTKMLDGIDDAFARTALKLGGNMLSEGLEEGLQEVLTPLFKSWALRVDEDINWSEVAYSGLLGALTAGFMEGGTTIAGEVKTYQTGKQLQAADISAQRLAEIGKTFSADTVAYQLAGRVNENTGAYTMGRLFNEIGATLSEQNVTEITEALVKEGIPSDIARDKAKLMAKIVDGIVDGATLSDGFIDAIEDDKILAKAVRATIIDANTTWYQRSKGYNEALKALADEMTSQKASRAKTAQQGEANAPASDTVDTQKENGTESLSEADSVDTSPAKVQSISSIKNGQATIKLEDGSEVDVKKADLDPDDGVRIETIASIEGISASDANFIWNTLRTATNASAQMDSLGAKEAYKYGFYGLSQEHLTKYGVFANSLTASQRQAIYETGKNARQQQIEKTTPKKGTGTNKETGIYFDNGNGNVVAFKDVKKTLTDKQSAGVKAAMVLKKLGIGGDIYFFESYLNNKGQRVYKDKNGKEVKAPNGWYSKDGSIHIDLNAGNTGSGFVLFTLAHELTHFIEQWSPQKYKILADFLVENYERGQSIDKLVRAKQDKLSALRGKKVSYKEAYSEVIADSMEAMLADGNVMDKLLELKAKDNSLFMKMKQFFDNLLAKIRNIYKGQTPDSAESRAVLEMTDSIEKIQQLFADALVEASENFQMAEKNTTQEGGVKMQTRSVNGNEVVWIEENILKENKDLPVHQFIANYISEHIGEVYTIIESGQKVYIGEDLPGEYTQSKYTKAILKNNPNITRVKNRASANLGEMIEIATNRRWEKTKHPGSKDAKYGMYRYDTSFGFPVKDAKGNVIGANIYDAELLIRNASDGKKYLYDIVSIKKNTAASNWLTQRVTSAAGKPAGQKSDVSNNKVTQKSGDVKNESVETLVDSGIAVDSDTDSGSIFSVRDVLDDAERKNVAKALVDRFGVTEKEAMEWLKAETSLASLILNPKYSSYLDYAADPNEVAIKQNSDYPQGTVDFSNICKKRREFTQVMNRVLRNFPNHVFAATDLAKIRTIMGEEGMTLPCGICYVEDRRQLDTIVAQDFIDGLKLYREGSKTRPDGKPFNANQLKGLHLTDGDTYVPTIYELVSLEGRNSLKAKNPNMEAAWVRYNNARAMQSVRLLTNEAEYKRQILKYSKKTVQSKNDHGGLRIYSFSDAEMFHLIDIIQVITDSAAVGLYLQGYTKVNEYAKAVKDTGEKLNRSLIPLGDLGYHMENGKVVLDYDTVEGIDVYHEDFFDNKDNPNVGNITIGINDIQIRAAMVSDFVDQIIPFHTGQSEEVLGEKGIAAWNNYKDFQTEKDLATGKTSNHQVNIYTEVIQAAEKEGKPIQNKRQFVEKFLQVCKENGLQPRFSQFLNTDAQGNYIYTEGYHKFLVDFKTFAQTEVGEYLPQGPVKPIFDDAYITGLLKTYVKEQKAKDADVAKQMPKVIERITNEIIKPTEVQRSDRDSDGNQLSAEQQEFFKDSKVRDEQGRLIPMYHGTNNPDFTVFDPQKSDDHISLFFTSDPDVANTYTHLQDKGRDVDPYNLITKVSTAEQFNKAQERVGGGLRVVKITPEWVQEMKKQAEKSSTRLLGVANKYADLLESMNESRIFNYDIDRIREVTGSGTRILKDSEISKLRSAMGSAKDHLFFVKDKRTREVSKIYSDTYKLFDEARNYAIAASTNKAEIGLYTYTETNSSVPFRLGTLYPGAERAMVANAVDRMKWVEEHHLGNRYKVYLNITNPYILDAGEDYSGVKKKAILEYDYRNAEWTVKLDDDTFIFDRDGFEDFALNAFDDKTYGEINAHIQDDNDADNSGLDDDSYGRYVDHYIKLKNVSVRYVAPGNWNALNFNGNENARTRDVAAWAKANGYDGVIFKNMKDAGGYAFIKGRGGSTVVTAFSSEQVKSVDNKKPTTDPDIRYSDRDTDGNQLTEDQQEFFENSKARDESGNLYVLYHGSRSPLFTEFDMYEGVWLTPDQRYAEVHAEMWHTWRGENQELTGLEPSVYADPDYRLYKMYANITNPLDLGEINDEFDRSQMNRLARLLGVPASRIRNISHHDGYQTVGFVYEVTKDHEFIEIAKEKGYDGFTATEKGRKTFCAFNAPNQVKLTTNEVPSGFSDIRYSDRDTDSVSNRFLLANALEGVAQNDIEKQKIQEYKGKISLINAEEQKLSELNEKIKELSFSKGPRDTKAIRDLQFEARQTANRINVYDKQLLRLEASKPLQDVLTREKKMAYKRAEQKGKEALEAYREKAMKTQRDLLDKWQTSRKKGIDSRHRTAMRHKIKDVVNELNQYLLRGTKDRHVPIELQKAVAEALDAVNMDTVGAEERIAKLQDELLKAKTPEQIQEISRKIDHIQEMGERMNGKLQKLKDAYDQFVNSDDPLIANSHDEVISNKLQSVIETIGDTPLRDMTLAQLEDVYDMYRMVLTTIRNANKAFRAKKSESISVIANQVMMEVEKVGGKNKLAMKGMDGIKSFGWNNLKPVYAFEHIGSDHFTEVFNNVRDGEDVWAIDITEAREFFLDKAKKHNYDSWDFKKRHKFTSTSGMDFELNLEQIMSLYAYSKRDQAADHLKKGGIVIDETTEITVQNKLGIPVKFNPTEATAYNISEETLADIISKLTKEQQSFVDEMQDYLSVVMGAKGNEVSLVMYGVKLFKEKFYFPLKSAHQFMAKAKEQAQGEVKIKNSGFSKETVQKASNPIVLTPFMNVWANHVNEMSMYHAFVLPMEDFYRVYNYKTPTSDTMATESVEMFIQNAYGKGATKYIDQLLKDLNGGARTDSTTGIINKMMGLFKKGAVFASLSVVVQQPSAIARAAALVDTKYFIGPKVDHKRHKALWDEVKQYAPVAIIKEMGYFDTNMGKSTQDFILGKEYSGFSEKMKALVTDSGYRDEILSKAPALADELAWCSIWEAVKRETKAKNPSMDTKSEAFLKKAGERFTEVITKTQVYDSVLSRSALMRSKDTGMKMATAFMAEPTTSINMIADALLQGKRGNKKYARAAIGAVVASQILNSILVSFVYAGRDDDEDETYLEKYIGTLTGEVLDSLNPAGYIPFIKDIMSIVQGYDVERSDMAVISDLWTAWQNLSKDNVSAYRKVEGFAGSIAQIFGLPVKNIMRDARGIYQTVMSFVNGQQTTKAGIGYAVKGAITGQTVSNGQQLYEAYMSGDQTQIARVEGRYENRSAINSAIRKALRENDPRIHEAAVARNNGDIAEYARIAKAIIAEGHFSQDNVVAAINAEINAMAKGETTSSNPKASGLYKAEDFALAISQGDSAMANAIKVDIIQTAQKNGKTEEEAEKSFASSAKGDLKELYLAGSVTEDQSINALTTYCGDTQEDAEKRVGEWEFEGEYGFAYSDRADAYKSGVISAQELQDILVNVGGKTEEEAVWQVKVYDWQNEGFDIDSNQKSVVEDYETYCEPAGIDKNTYFDAYLFYADSGEEGVAYSKTIECMPYIDSLPLSSSQKTALALCWWAESTVNKYKTW